MAAIETYVSTDIEADGPIPGPHSMLSLGSAAFNEDGRLLDTFTANLLPLPRAAPHPRYTEFWQGNPDAFAATQMDRCDPEQAMRSYVAWVEALPGLPVFVAYPAGFDFTFVYYYLHRFTGGSPFSHSALDIKTVAMLLLHTGYRRATKRYWPREWFPRNSPHTHRALDDAIEQGREFCAMLIEARRLPPRPEHPRGAASRGRAGSRSTAQELPAPAHGADIRADLLALQEYGRARGDPADQRPVHEWVRSALRQPSEGDRRAMIQTLVDNIKVRLPDLRELLEACDDQWGGEDHVYRFYRGSLEVYQIQALTGRLVDALRSLLPGQPLDVDFEQIIREGTGHVFALEHNQEWLLRTRPMLEAFWHAQYMVSMAVKYGPESRAPAPGLPSGWAAVLTLYGVR